MARWNLITEEVQSLNKKKWQKNFEKALQTRIDYSSAKIILILLPLYSPFLDWSSKLKIRNAMDKIEEVSCVKFVPKQRRHNNYLFILSDSG